jgi:hypothetical protein
VAGGMAANSRRGLDHRPGVRPDTRMVGDSVVLVMRVLGAPIETPLNLILRVDPDGEVFASLDYRRIERSKL